jgi:hypothetical protein
VLAHLVPRAADPSALAARVATALATAGAGGAGVVASPHPDARLTALMALYSAVPAGEAKAAVLGRAAALAAAVGPALAGPLAAALRGRAAALQRELALPDAVACEMFLSLAALNQVRYLFVVFVWGGWGARLCVCLSLSAPAAARRRSPLHPAEDEAKQKHNNLIYIV